MPSIYLKETAAERWHPHAVLLFHLLHWAPTVNNPHVCIKNSESLISCDSRTPRNSGTNFKLEGENVTRYRYLTPLYCLGVQAGFYSDVVECRTSSPEDRGRSPVGEKCYFKFLYLATYNLPNDSIVHSH